jgi:superoxide dismutase
MDVCLENRVEFFQKIGPDIALQMTEAPQKLTAEKIEVEFGGVQAFEEGKVLIDAGEKCFGSFMN